MNKRSWRNPWRQPNIRAYRKPRQDPGRRFSKLTDVKTAPRLQKVRTTNIKSIKFSEEVMKLCSAFMTLSSAYDYQRQVAG